MKKYIAELIGTFVLVFCGTGAVVLNDVYSGGVGQLGIAIGFGLSVTLMIYAFANASGAHINPAVSIAFSLTDRFDKKLLLGYIIAQIIGGILASLSLRILFTEHDHLGTTLPSGSWQQSFVLEIILSYILVLVVLFVSQRKSISRFTAIAVGAIVLLEAYFAGPITGASMNPARSIAPAIVSGNISHLWLYILAPIVGGVLASYSWSLFFKTTRS